ncbi:GIY-YIG nuclease family protein [candidate division WWE3 bacterium]|jgi:hypothetical protein|nr:GIY-YIG nuclease family protein [candidate division WWE3 bacterium]
MLIYKTTNKINGKFYIGQQVGDDEEYIGSGKLIKSAIEKYGKESFTKDILEECATRDEMNEREIYWIDKLKSLTPNGYNIHPGGYGGYNEQAVIANKKRKGKTWEEIYGPEGLKIMKEVVKKTAKANGDRLRKHIQENGAWNKGKTGYKMPPCSEERKHNISKANMGKTVTKETRTQIRETLKDVWNDPDSVFNSTEYRNKLSEAQKKSWAKRQITKERFLEVFTTDKPVTEKCVDLGVSLPTYYKYRKQYGN